MSMQDTHMNADFSPLKVIELYFCAIGTSIVLRVVMNTDCMIDRGILNYVSVWFRGASPKVH